jgi:thioredoxin-related protein
VFDATKPKFNDIEFVQYDLDTCDNDLKSRYAVTSIPRVVFLDSSGKVLYNGGVSIANWEQQIREFHP